MLPELFPKTLSLYQIRLYGKEMDLITYQTKEKENGREGKCYQRTESDSMNNGLKY